MGDCGIHQSLRGLYANDILYLNLCSITNLNWLYIYIYNIYIGYITYIVIFITCMFVVLTNNELNDIQNEDIY